MPTSLRLLKHGAQLLRAQATAFTPEEIKSPATADLLSQMKTMMRETGGVGLAAPQVGVSKRLFVAEVEGDSAPALPFTCFFNPRIAVLPGRHPAENTSWEQCLSLPGIAGLVTRPGVVQVHFLDERARARALVARGWFATLVQHEADHLDGRVYLHRLASPHDWMYEEELRALPRDRLCVGMSGDFEFVEAE
mmetsp:Transcript_3523/g.8481  ORF Transcript_3523/g.8481 Transcript_3523/m.8481 type:complete len:193 (+) Transcript_3523:88-666(+)|eukprot:CAMPEP_0177653466 /NCGR_PEP_ID=MMETSP0447-20121125/13752_1 /TAXON_ID=0 /ORGANISM="Stygamoeba regulata, Strain BSH-02190019" /LENGTH=192 /DNA_ID=CAMNT_0019156927 /DNA_START=74 /DNA_END=652 /DNA_ORIENTATION=-